MNTKNILRVEKYSNVTVNFTAKAFAIDISQGKLTAAKGELVVKQGKPSVIKAKDKNSPIYKNLQLVT
ncbi:MAG: hypothetical protein QXV69_09065 [Sulfolobaceae archaeon]